MDFLLRDGGEVDVGHDVAELDGVFAGVGLLRVVDDEVGDLDAAVEGFDVNTLHGDVGAEHERSALFEGVLRDRVDQKDADHEQDDDEDDDGKNDLDEETGFFLGHDELLLVGSGRDPEERKRPSVWKRLRIFVGV